MASHQGQWQVGGCHISRLLAWVLICGFLMLTGQHVSHLFPNLPLTSPAEGLHPLSLPWHHGPPVALPHELPRSVGTNRGTQKNLSTSRGAKETQVQTSESRGGRQQETNHQARPLMPYMDFHQVSKSPLAEAQSKLLQKACLVPLSSILLPCSSDIFCIYPTLLPLFSTLHPCFVVMEPSFHRREQREVVGWRGSS